MSQKEPEKKYDLCGTICNRKKASHETKYLNRRSSWSTDSTTSYEGDDRHVKRLVAEWGFDQCVPASAPPAQDLEDNLNLSKAEYKAGRTIARIKLHAFGQTGCHPGITDSVKAHVEACEWNKACFVLLIKIFARTSNMCQQFQGGNRQRQSTA